MICSWYNKQYDADTDDDDAADESDDDDDDGDSDRERLEIEFDPAKSGTEIRLVDMMMWKAGPVLHT